jgi:hypothetical protein
MSIKWNLTEIELKEAPEKLFLFQWQDGRFEMLDKDTFLLRSEECEPSSQVTEYIRKDIYESHTKELEEALGFYANKEHLPTMFYLSKIHLNYYCCNGKYLICFFKLILHIINF